MVKLRSRLGPRGQTVIPKAIRQELGLRPGDELVLHLEGGRAVIEPATQRDALSALLSLQPKRSSPRKLDWHREPPRED